MKDYILRSGLVVGGTQVIMLLLSYFIGAELMLSGWWSFFNALIVLILVVSIDF